MKNMLVSLISDQTIPNVQLIKEFDYQIDKYLFITTSSMEKKGVRNSIIRACKIDESKLLEQIEVDQFSFDDIENELDKIDFEGYDRIVVNLTGGTKVMTLAAFDYFKEVGAEIYYVTGHEDELIKVSPGRTKKKEKIRSSVNVSEYLESYGFTITQTEESGIDTSYSKTFFDLFTNNKLDKYSNLINLLRTKFRSKNSLKLSSIDGLEAFINEIDFPLKDRNKEKMNKYEVKYITGEWFEEYVANRVKEELNLTEEFIATGLQITKKNRRGENVPNEMDVVFVFKNKIYVIECKTSVFYDEEQADGTFKSKSIIGETLYKSDSLKQGLGLFTNTFLFILDSISDNNQKLKTHLERADLFNIKVVDKDAILNAERMIDLLNLNI